MDERSKKEAIDAIANCTNCGDEKTLREYVIKHSLENGWTGGVLQALDAVKDLPSAEPDAVTASLEELINDYGEDGYFIVDGVNYQANELLNELKINSSVGEKFRKQIAKTIVQYFMKFGG